MRVVVETQWSVVKPAKNTCRTACSRRNDSSPVPMKDELTLFQNTGSDPSAAGTAKSNGLIPSVLLEWSSESGKVEEWKT